MKKQYIYIVMGTTGEYSDQMTWPVAAYFDKKLAEQHEKLAYDWALKAAKPDSNAETWRERFWEGRAEKNPYDPDMKMDYTGTDYFCYTIEIRKKIPDNE